MRGRRKVFHLLFGLALALGIMLAMSLVAYADDSDPFTDGVDYIDENGVVRHLNRSEYKIYGIDEQVSEPIGDGWHVVTFGGDVTKRVEVTGNAKILLLSQRSDVAGPTIRFTEGIHVPEGASLSIYGQTTTEIDVHGQTYPEKDTAGKLIATGDDYDAGIGGNYGNSTKDEKCGTINVYGGYVEVTGGREAAGIGGGRGWVRDWTRHGGNGNRFYMKDGWVYATGGSHGAGIGGGYRGNSGSGGIVIDGGYLEAVGGDNSTSNADDATGGAGIGGGEARHTQYYGETGGCAENITINGGVVKAYGTEGGAGIGAGGYGNGGLTTGNWIKINGGHVEAYGSEGGAGIGGGNGGPLNDWYPMGAGANVEITGGQVLAKGSDDAAGIGAAKSKSFGSGKTIIKGKADVTARGGDYAAGIGTGNEPTTLYSSLPWNKPYDIEISGEAKVYAYGGKEGAGIGCGNEGINSAGRKGELTISGDAVVNAVGGKYGAGIGGGDQQVNGRVTINGGTVNADGGYGAAGIGDGDDCTDETKFNSSGNIYINGGTVNATGGDFGAGIGGADGSNFIAGPDTSGEFGKIFIKGGKVTAKATKEAAGIGGGNYWTGHGGGNGCDVTIDLSNKEDFVLAVSDDDSAPIGHGDSGDSDGTLNMGDKSHNYLSVKKKASREADYDTMNAEIPVATSARISECQNDGNKTVLLQYCADTNEDAMEYEWYTNLYHHSKCPYCDYAGDKGHDTLGEGATCSRCNGEVATTTVTFMEGDPAEVTSTMCVRTYSKITLPDYNESKVPEGLRFAGWGENGERDLDHLVSPSDDITAWGDELTLDAIYGEGADITFDAGEGSGTMPKVESIIGMRYYLPDHSFTAPDEDSKFAGWKCSYDGDEYNPNGWVRLTGDVTFTAQWEGHKHSMTHYNAVAATCEKDGNIEYWECKRCEKLFKDSEGTTMCTEDEIIIPKLGHNWDAPTYSWSDDNSSVTAERICLNDYKHKKTETVNTTSTTTDSTCYSAGETVYTAVFTKDVFTTQTKTVTIDKKPHNWSDWTDNEDQTKEVRVCQNPGCGAVEERAKGHEHTLVKVDQKDPTCEESGMKAYWVCDGCGKWYADEDANQEIIGDTEEARKASLRIPALGHKLGAPEEYGEATPATCEEPGNYKTIRRCTVEGCGFSTKDNPSVYIIPALGHNWSEEIVKPATCTDEGLKRQTCLRCGESNDTVIPALGGEHEWGEWAVTKPATEKETGQKERACENCGVVETEIIPVMVTSVTVNSGTVSAKTLMAAVAKAGGDAENIKTFVLGKKVKKISKYAFKNYKNAKTLVIKTKKLKKAKVKNSLKGSAVTKVKVKVGSKKINKKYVKKYKKFFTKKNAGKKVKVTL